jgi:hypothetical protein
MLLGIASMALDAQPIVKYSAPGISASEVELITPNDPAFETELRVFLAHPRTDLGDVAQIRPFMIFLKNRSKEGILLASVRWDRVFQGRPTVSLICMNTRHLDGSAAFTPGLTYAALPWAGGVIGPGLATAPRPEVLPRLLVPFLETKEVDVVLDAVIFDTGRLVGLDRGGIVVRYDAERKATQDLAAELHKLKSQGAGVQATKRYLEGLAGLRPEPRSIPDMWRDVEYNYSRRQRGLAMGLLAFDRAENLDVAISWVEAQAAQFRDLFRANSPK